MKAAPKKENSTQRQRQKLVDEFVALDKEIQEFKPRMFRHEKIRRLILDWYPSLAADTEAIVPGTAYDILISSKDPLRTVTLEGRKKLAKLWGLPKYLENSIVYLKSLPDPDDKRGMYSAQNLTGPRHLHVVQKSAKTGTVAA